MERKQVMKKTIRHILSDLERIRTVVHMLEEELNDLEHHVHPASKVAGMKEKLSEIHARLDGMKEFVEHCQKQSAVELVEQEVDIWL